MMRTNALAVEAAMSFDARSPSLRDQRCRIAGG
jgi:hypothetical protein